MGLFERREDGRVGVRECGEQRGGGGGSVYSEVKHVVAVGGAPDLKGADGQSSLALSL